MRIGLKQYIAPGSEILHAFLSPHMVEGKLQALSPGVMRWHKFISKKEVSNPHICWETKQKQKKLKWLRTQKHSDTEDSFQSRYSKASNLQGGE